jgi:predicted  nucleic acid-binding Zn-ribbon protein
VRASDEFARKVNEKEQNFLKLLNFVAEGKSREFENEVIEKSFKGEIARDELIKTLNRVNKTIYDLQQDKSDLQDIIDTKINRLLSVADKIGKLKQKAELAYENTIESIADLTVKITQLATTAQELSRWETPAEISSRFDHNSAKEKIRQKATTIRTKAKLLTDKLDKIFSELNVLKKISDHTYLIAVNSSIFAEKASSSKMELLSTEIKKISENLLNSQDQLYYLATEARNAIYACSNDLETIEIVLENTPTQSDIAKMLLEYSKFNERIASISNKFDNVVDEFRNILKNTETAKSDLAKLDGIIEELINISESI